MALVQGSDAASPGPAAGGFRGDINGLRTVAVMSVLAFHFAPGFAPGGFVGVDVFFVISGYLMTGIIVGRLTRGTFSLWDFYLARAQRIIPALAAVVAAVLIGGAIFLLPSEFLVVGKHAAGSVTFASNILYWMESGYFDAGAENKWLLHTWSLSVEWQFYLIYPLVMMAVAKVVPHRWFPPLVALAALASFALMLHLSVTSPRSGFFLLPPRIWEMLAGGLIYLLPPLAGIRARMAQIAGLALVFLSVATAQAQAWPDATTLLPVIGTALVILASLRHSRITGNAVVSWIGLRSYSIYLWHWPLAVMLARSDHVGDPAYILAGIAASLVLGHFSWRFLERVLQADKGKPHIHLSPHVVKLKAHAIPAVLVGVAAVAGAAVWALRGLPQRFPAEIARIAQDAAPNPYGPGCFSVVKGVPEPCIVGPHKDRALVTLLGDSHADAEVSALVAVLPSDARGGVAFNAYASCAPLLGARSSDPENKCEAFNARFLAAQTRSRTTPLILVAYWNGYFERPSILFPGDTKPSADAFAAQFVATACALTKAGPTYAVMPTPQFPVRVAEDLQQRVIRGGKVEDRSVPLAGHLRRSARAIAMLKTAERKCSLRLLDPLPYLCEGGKCPASIDRRPLYYDKHHLSEYGNKRLAPLFRPVIEQAIGAAKP